MVHERRFVASCEICGQNFAHHNILDRHKYMKQKDDPRVAEIRKKFAEKQQRKSLTASGFTSSVPSLKRTKQRCQFHKQSMNSFCVTRFTMILLVYYCPMALIVHCKSWE